MRISNLLCFSVYIIAVPCAFPGANVVNTPHGMVVAEHKIAAEVGATILKLGGNAIDAAVAVGYTLAVVYPCCGNIGGGGFMTMHLASGENIFLNFREKAPLKASGDMYLKASLNATTKGYLSVAVPGTVLGLDTALQKYGTMNRQQVMEPAITLASSGFIVTPFVAELFADNAHDFRADPAVAAIFLKSGKPYQAGETLIQKQLAQNLQSIADKGPQAFYNGPIAQAIVNASKKQGGILEMDDFAKYSVEFLVPIQCNYRGYTIISAPPPSSGGITLCEILNILENFPLNRMGPDAIESTQYTVEAMRYGFIDRNAKMGDPDFIINPVAQLISKDYAKQLSERVLSTVSNPSTPGKMYFFELTDTTHYSVVDDKGNAVAVTYTLNGYFGAGVIAPNTGFFLNDEMDDFETHPGKANKFGLIQSSANAIEPGKRPLSSMAPTIIMKDGNVFMVLGSPGGPRIITSVLQTILNVLDYGMDIQQAVDAPRIHYQAQPDTIYAEPFALNIYTQLYLEFLDYNVTEQPDWSAVEAILIDPKDGSLHGANDFRRPDGAAIGF